jgi:hypothetical protein
MSPISAAQKTPRPPGLEKNAASRKAAPSAAIVTRWKMQRWQGTRPMPYCA